MTCGMCPFTDGMCYTSDPPKRKCTITGEFHYYDYECNCEMARIQKDFEQKSLIKNIVDPKLDISYNSYGQLAINGFDVSEIETGSVDASVTASDYCTNCLICGGEVILQVWESAYKVCNKCKKAIELIKEKFKEELND